MGIMEAQAPEWLFPLLEAEFRTARTANRDRNNYSFYCMTCKGNSIREIDKSNHPNHEILRAVKASHHFAVRVLDMERRLSCNKIAQFSFNNNWVFFLKSRVKPESSEEENGKNKHPSKKAKRSEPAKACTVCGWRLPEGDTSSLYCSLACKFKRNDVNPKQDKDLNEEQAAVDSNKQNRKQEKDLNEEQAAMDSDKQNPKQYKDLNKEQAAVVSDKQAIAREAKGMEYSEMKMNSSFRKRSRKGIPFRSQSH